MALLDKAQVRKSRTVMWHSPHCVGRTTGDHTEMDMTTQVISCVEVTIPEQDWFKIEQIIQAHQRVQHHPAVQDAWAQYVMVQHLTDRDLPKHK